MAGFSPVWGAGGEDCSTATAIPSLPYTDTGNTSAALNDYDDNCGFGPNGGNDLVYEYSPSNPELVTISLCAGITDYDTRLYVYENACPASGSGGNVIACSEDVCANPPLFTFAWISEISSVTFLPGNTYYIVIDGYSATANGDYELTMTASAADVEATALVDPSAGSGCNLTPASPVSVSYTNSGVIDVNEVYLYLEANGVPIVQDTVNGPLTVGQTAFHTFSLPADLSALGTQNVRFAALAAGDGNSANDTLSVGVFNFTTQLFPTVDFNNFAFDLNASVPFMQEAVGDGSPTNYGFSGWNSSNNTQTTALGSTTAKLNIWGTSAEIDAWMVGPLVQVTPGLELRFDAALTDYNNADPGALGTDDSVKIMLSPDCGGTWLPLLVFGENNAPPNTLTPYVVDLTPYAGAEVLLGFYGTNGSVQDTTDSDFHIDNIQLINPNLPDATPDGLVAPSITCGLTSNELVTIDIANQGPQASEVYAYLEVDGVPIVTDTIAGPIAASSVFSHTFSQGVDFSAAGDYDVLVVASVDGDINPTNDTTTFVVTSTPPLPLPLAILDFEGFTGGNLPTIHPGWREAGGNISGPNAGPFSGWTNSTGTQTGGLGTTTARVSLFTSDQNSWMLGPNFIAATNTRLRFDAAVTNWTDLAPDSMGSDDVIHVMVSDDCGVTWTSVFQIDTLNEPGNALTTFTVPLGSYAGQEVQVGIFATSGPVDDPSFYDFHIDNVQLATFPGVDVGITALLNPNDGCSLGANEAIAVEFTHLGIDTVVGPVTVPLRYQIDNNPVVEDSLVLGANDTLLPTAVVPFTFATLADFSTLGTTYELSVWTDLGDPLPSNDSLSISFETKEATPISVTAPGSLCLVEDTITLSANYYGGEWAGPGLISPQAGTFNPALMPGGDSVMITYNFDQDYGMTEIPFAPQSTVGGNVLPLGDDDFEEVPLGFSFQFGGEAYSSVFVGSNGFLAFGEGSTTTLNQTLPDPAAPNNLIALAWDDLDPTDGGEVRTQLMGTAPNQMLVVEFDSVPHYDFLGSSTNYVDAQVIFYEGSNVVEMHVASIDTDGFGMTQGIETSSGTKGYATTDSTNDEPFTQSNVAYRFEPTSCPGFDTAMVYVGPGEAFAEDTLNLCQGDTLMLDAQNAGGTYLWNTGATTQTIEVLAAGNFYVDYTDANGCTGTDTVEVTEVPGLSLALDGSSEPLCFGDSTGSIDLGITGVANPFTIMWSNGVTTEDLSDLAAGTYEVMVSDTNGCVEELEVVIGQPDALGIDPAVTDVACADDSDGGIRLATTGGTAPYTYLWSDASTADSLVGVGPGTYSVEVLDANGCVAADTFTVTATDSLPTAGFTFAIDGDEVTFTNTSDNADTFSWSFGDLDGTVSSDESPVFEYNLDGNYVVTLIVENACGADTFTAEIPIATSLQISDLGDALRIAPNPNQGTFTLYVDSPRLTGVQVQLSDARGRIVYRSDLGDLKQGASHTIELEGRLGQGIYLLQVQSGEGQALRRIVVE